MTFAERAPGMPRPSRTRAWPTWPIGVAVCAGLLLGAGSALAAKNPESRDTGPVEPEAAPKQPNDTHFWIDGGGGYGAINMNTFVIDNEEALTAELVPLEADGIAGNLGFGL